MAYHYHSSSVTPPPFSPPAGPGQAESEKQADDHKSKRRRLEDGTNTANPKVPSGAASMPAAGPFPGHGYLASAGEYAHISLNSSSFWDQDATLDYLASTSGFSRDLRDVMLPFQQHPFGPGHLSVDNHGQRLRDPVNVAPYHLAAPPHSGPPLSFLSMAADPQQSAEYLRQMAVSMSYGPPTMAFSPPMPGPLMNSLPSYDGPHRVPPSRSVGLLPTEPVRRPAPPSRAGITLTLSRATAAAIEELPEHKRECPACQLEFEPDNYVAKISCCGTAMHAACLSAWVNSQTYSKNKVCMKCRRAIDARRALNHVVPPVNDKSWDEGADLNAPPNLKEDARIELNVTGRPERTSQYRRARTSSFGNYRPRQQPLSEEVSAETRHALQRLRESQRRGEEEIKQRCRAVYADLTRAYEEEATANRALAEARGRLAHVDPIKPFHADCLAAQPDRGPRTPTVSAIFPELEILIRRCQETKHWKEKIHESYRVLSREQDAMLRVHQQQVRMLLEDALLDNYRRLDDTPARGGPAFDLAGR